MGDLSEPVPLYIIYQTSDDNLVMSPADVGVKRSRSARYVVVIWSSYMGVVSKYAALSPLRSLQAS